MNNKVKTLALMAVILIVTACSAVGPYQGHNNGNGRSDYSTSY